MKIKIRLGEEEREINISLRGKDQKEFLKKIGEIAKSVQKDQEDPEKLLSESEDFLNYQDNVISKATGLTTEQLDDLDLEEKNKIIEQIRGLLLPWGKQGFF